MQRSRAQSLIPGGPNYRAAAFIAGLEAVGYQMVDRIADPAPGDVLVIWNRQLGRDAEGRRFEAAGAGVLVAENGYLGKQWLDRKWFSLGWGHHAGAGEWWDGGAARWTSWNVELAPWRDGPEVVILSQRAIGEPGIASPQGWAETVQRVVGGRIRAHPGVAAAVPLEVDLARAGAAVTWASGAALQALLLGVPVWYGMERWIGASAGRSLSEFGGAPRRDNPSRLAMFQRLAWAMWTEEEVANGQAFETLLRCR